MMFYVSEITGQSINQVLKLFQNTCFFISDSFVYYSNQYQMILNCGKLLQTQKFLFNFLDERIQIISFYQIDALMRFYFEVGEIGLKINELKRNIFSNRENSDAM